MSSQDLDQNNDTTCKTNDCQRSQKIIEDGDLDYDKGKNEKKYQDLIKSINYLKKFDWFDGNNQQIKIPPIKLLTPAAFWFMVCAEYFPRSLSVGTEDPTQTLTEVLQKIERQHIQQIIRVKDMSYLNLKSEQLDEQTQLQIQKVKEAIRKIKFGKPQANIRNSAILKEDYTFEDDEYIIDVRNNLLDLYGVYLHPEFQQNKQQSCSSSESTMVEDDSRNLFPNKDDLSIVVACADKINLDSTCIIAKQDQTEIIGEESQNNQIKQNQQQIKESRDFDQKQEKVELNDINEYQGEDMEIEIQVNDRKEDSQDERDLNSGEEVENFQQSLTDQIQENKEQVIIKQKPNRNFNEEEVLKIMKKQDLDEIINLYQFHLTQQEKELQVKIDDLKKSILDDIVSERIIFKKEELDLTDILIDVHQYSSIEQEYLNFLENKQQFIDFEAERNTQNQNQTKQHVKSQENNVMEDMACQICNDGDYSEDDLIVFCSKCNVSVHQRCYGIPKIPNDDWICELCLSFGPDGKYLRCALCTQRGGAMKPSKIPITSNIFQNTNTSYYEFQKTCKAGPPNKKQRYENPNEKQTKNISDSKQNIQENEEIQDENECGDQYYDYHELVEFTEEELKNEPKPYFVWCHITCALWTPECFFDDKNYYTNIKGIETIEKTRYKLECSICKQKKAGSCVQCAKTKCMEAFHPECARKQNTFLEIRNTDKLAYLIYCERHTPLKLRRHLEQKEKKYKEEIIKFCKSIEKSREFRNKEKNTKKERDRQQGKDKKKQFEKRKLLISAKKIRQQITKNEEDSQKEETEFQQALINKMIEYIDNLKPEDIKKTNEQSDQGDKSPETKDQTRNKLNSEENSSNNEQKTKSSKKNNLWQNQLFAKKEEPFWKDISYKSLSINQIFKRYKKIQRDKIKKKEFKQLYLKTLSVVKNIKFTTKEERLLEKEKKKLQKQQKRQQKIQDIFQKTQEKKQKKLGLQYVKDQKESQKKVKETKFELSKKAIRRTNNKKDSKINDKKQQKLAKQNQMIEQVTIIHANYEPVDETSEQIYCICRRKYQEGDQMMACEKCEEWYHLDCVGFQGTIQQAENIEFVCKFCDFKDTDQQKRKERKDCYGHLFQQYDEPNYDFLKELTQKKIKAEQNDQEKVQDGSEIESEKSMRKKRNSNNKQSQKVKKKQKSKQQSSEDQSSSSKKQNEENSNSPESGISVVQKKFDYNTDEPEEVIQEELNENFAKSNQIQSENNLNKKFQNEEVLSENNNNSQTIQCQTNLNQNILSEYSSSDILNKQNEKIELNEQSKVNENLNKMEIEQENQKEIKQKEQQTKEESQKECKDYSNQKQEQITQQNEIDNLNLTNQQQEQVQINIDQIDQSNKLNQLDKFVYSTKLSKSQIKSQLSNKKQNTDTSDIYSEGQCNIKNIDTYKFKQKSLKDFKKKK